MLELILLAVTPPMLSCTELREIAEVVEADTYLSAKEKNSFMERLFGKHMRVDCFKK